MKKYLRVMLVGSFVLITLFALSACGEVSSHIHTYGDWKTTLDATCSIIGQKERICSECNEKETETIEKLPHTLGEFEIDVAATCTTVGSKSKHCTICEANAEITEIAATGHSYDSSFTIDKAATCTTIGSKSKHCSVCEAKAEVTEIAMLPHTLGEFEIDIAATCTTIGSKSKHCTICEAKAEVTEIAMLPHTLGEFEIDVAATCTTVGSKSKCCLNCQTKDEVTEIAMLPHTLGEFEIDVAATCTTLGSKSKRCSDCQTKAEVTEIAMLPHTLGEFEIDIAATCTTVGSKSKCCLDCQTKAEVTEIAMLPHALGEFEIDIAATCTTVGSKSKHCSACQTKAEVTEIAMLPHALGEFEIDIAATCTMVGSKSKHCSACQTKAEVTEIAALGHSYGFSFTIDKAATCTTVGSKSKHCSACEAKAEVTEIAALGHSYDSSFTFDVIGTCVVEGIRSRHCLRDNCDSKTQIINDGLNLSKHLGEKIENIKTVATCSYKGKKTIACGDCNKIIQEIELDINLDNHVGEKTTTIPAYCDEEGTIIKTCSYSYCALEISRTPIPKDPNKHKEEDSDYIIEKQPTCVESGWKYRKCVHCGERFDETFVGLQFDGISHVWATDFTIDVAPTCVSGGSKSIHCIKEHNSLHNKDYEKKSVTQIPMLQHVYGSEYQFITNNETSTYQHARVCNNCPNKLLKNCSLTLKSTVQPTETKAGYYVKDCSVCNHSRNIVFAFSRNKDYTITQTAKSLYTLKNSYDTLLISGNLNEAMAALENHRAWGTEANRDCTILLNDLTDTIFNMEIGECIVLGTGKYTLSGKVKGNAGTSTLCLIRVQFGADVTLDGANIEVTAGEGVKGGAIYVERGSLTVKNSSVIGSAGMENEITGIIMIKMGCTLNIYDGAIIRNTKNKPGIKSFAISTQLLDYNNTRDYATINMYGGLVEAQKDSTVYGYNLIFNMSGGEVNNLASTDDPVLEGLTLMGNSIANITGGKITAAKKGVYVCNDINKNLATGGTAEHIIINCEIVAAVKFAALGKGTLNGVPVLG